MQPEIFIRKNIISTLLAEGVLADDAQGGLPLHWITTADALRRVARGACSMICFTKPVSGSGFVRAAMDVAKPPIRGRGVCCDA